MGIVTSLEFIIEKLVTVNAKRSDAEVLKLVVPKARKLNAGKFN